MLPMNKVGSSLILFPHQRIQVAQLTYLVDSTKEFENLRILEVINLNIYIATVLTFNLLSTSQRREKIITITNRGAVVQYIMRTELELDISR
jgi:hypothetical protein